MQKLCCAIPLSILPTMLLENFRNGSEEMGALEKVGRRAVTEVVILLSIPVAIIETVVRAPFALIASTLSFVIPSSWRAGKEFCEATVKGVMLSFVCGMMLIALAVTNTYMQVIIKEGDSSLETVYFCCD